MKLRSVLATTGVTVFAAFSPLSHSHSEHDKARFVSEQGVDKGLCDNALRPCKSIVYAVQQASKGDRVLVASGEYKVTSPEELFYLKSDIVPTLGGYNRFDHFKSQSPATNPTYLSGVPEEMAAELRNQGFTIITDGKAQIDSKVLKQKMHALKQLDQFQADTPCTNGQADVFPCDKVDLVSHMPLFNFGGNPAAGSDIWGHIDLNTGKEYALMGFNNGVSIVDLSDPENPQEVEYIVGNQTSWRDIKVFQFYDDQASAWRAYAYVTIDGGAADGLTILDLSLLPTVTLVEKNTSVVNAHNVYISNVDYGLNIAQEGIVPTLQILGANRNGGSFNSYSLNSPQTVSITQNQSSFNGYTHDGASVRIDDARATDCVNGTSGCTVFVDFNEKEMVLWDVTVPSDTRELSQIGYTDVPSANQYVHSGWVSEDKRFVFLHDEFDENRGGLNSTVRVFSIDSLTSPTRVATWTGPTRAIDHNGFVRGNRYYLSNYERGLTILDITDPTNPVDVGYFDTFPSSDNASFNGAWGVYPFLPSGLILVSDINSGLYVVRDKTLDNAQGSIRMVTDEVQVTRGDSAQIDVSRLNVNANAVTTTVAYEVIPGSARSGSDFSDSASVLNGTLTWTANDSTLKSFTIPTVADPNNLQSEEIFFVRLLNPTSGATISTPTYTKVVLNGVASAGSISLENNTLTVPENGGDISISVSRTGGTTGIVSVNYQLVSGTATVGTDVANATGTIIWQDGESDARAITLSITDDNDIESAENFTLELAAANGNTVLGSNSQTVVTIDDDDSNSAPVANAGENFEVNTSQTVQLVGSATDSENDTLSYSWQQTSGVSVNLTGATNSTASFVAPSSEATLEFALTVTDTKGANNTANVTVTVVQAVGDDDSGGSLSWLVLLLVLAGFRRRT